jgi:signal transduction histidine kinase/DNA-binding response OmpR family regulator
MASEKILVIDPSEQDIRPLVDEVLYPAGYVVVHALDGEEGLRQAMDGNPDLIVAELATPRRSGLDILAQLRQVKREVPFILVGVSSSAEIFRRALRLGVIDYLLKPLNLNEARSAIERALATGAQPLPARKTSLLARGFERINQQLERRVRELSILHGIGKAVTSIRDLEKLLNRIVEAAVYLTRAEEGFLLLINEGTDELYIRASQGLGEKLATSLRIKSEDSLSWQVVRTGKPIMVSGVTDEERFKLKTGYLVKALLHVPLKIRGEVIGVLSVDNKVARRSFTDNDLHLLSALADYAAVAIDNVRQYERAEVEAAKRAELLTTQGPRPVSIAKRGEAVPLDWLVGRLHAQQEVASERLRETERLAQELAAQVLSVEHLVDQWRSQRIECEQLVRRLASVEAVAVGEDAEVPATMLAQWQGVLDSLTEGLIITDQQGVVRLANRMAVQLLGIEDVTGKDLRLLSEDPHWATSVEKLQNGGTHDQSVCQEATFRRNGQLLKANFVSVSGQPGEDGGWAVILSDLGRERAIQSARDSLSAMISQELRTPMTILTSYTDLLLAEVVGLLVPGQRRMLEKVHANLMRMGEAVDSLMAVSPPAPEMAREALPAVDVRTVIEGVLADAAPWLEEKGLRAELDLAEGLTQAAAEADCVYQMIINLLRNAIQVTPPGGTIAVQAESRQEEDLQAQASYLVVSVRDQGGGVAPEFLSQVFERFYSEEDQPIPGLGVKGPELSLVKRLVETFGGRVWVKTEPGVGNTFSFVLPTVQNQ